MAISSIKCALKTAAKCIGFFLGWAILSAILPLSASDDPAVWRLWAEITPFLAMAAFTFLFWVIERKTVRLHLFDSPIKGIATGIAAGAAWLAVPVLTMYALGAIRFEGKNAIPQFVLWVLAAFLNVIMQELLVRGYLYQMLKQKHNIVAAVIVTTALFTVLHGGALEAGVVPTVNVVTMSLLMTFVLEYTGSLIAPTLMHFLWNGIGALVLGGVSLADDYPHLLDMTFSGNELLSGGVCKIEGSIVVLITNVVFITVFARLLRQRHAIKK